MVDLNYFKSGENKIPLPVFFPDATRAVLKTLDSADIENTKTPGVLVNTYHLYQDLGRKVIEKHEGVRGFMSWKGGLITDSGGFQVMTLAKANNKGTVSDKGVIFGLPGRKKELFTPEDSIRFQMILRPDLVVVLDDFTDPNSSYAQAKESVDRTILWAKESKRAFLEWCEEQELEEGNRPYLLGVVQGGEFLDLRKECTERLLEIGFDGLGYGGRPQTKDGTFSYETVKIVGELTPRNMFVYGLGIGRPEEIVYCVDQGYTIFDCVLPTRDARHERLYVYEAESLETIDIRKPNFYSYYTPTKEKHYADDQPASRACDCLLCSRYSRSYLAHLFKIQDTTALRLSTIHNLRFYSLLMEKLRKEIL